MILYLLFIPFLLWGQAVTVYPDRVLGSVPDVSRPGIFFVPRTQEGTADFVNNGIRFNSIRLINIELALNSSNVRSVSDFLAYLEADKAIYLYSSQRCDKLILPLLKIPRWLSSSTDTTAMTLMSDPSWKVFNAVPPANYDVWSLLMDSIVHKINVQWGLDAYYEIWNEPELYWKGTVNEYFTFFKNTYFGIKSKHPSAKVGGPVISSFTSCFLASLPEGYLPDSMLNRTIIGRVIDSCVAWNAPLDFISWHKFDPIILSIESEIEYLNRKLTSTGHGLVPYIVSEWNQTTELRDTPFATAFMPRYVQELTKHGVAAHMVASWQDFDEGTAEFHRDYGLLSTGALQKPAWKALLLQNSLQGEMVEASVVDSLGLSVFSAKNNGILKVLISNYSLPGYSEAVACMFYKKHFNAQDFINEGFGSGITLDSILRGLLPITGSSPLKTALQEAKSIYRLADSVLLHGRDVSIAVSPLNGTYRGTITIIDSTKNNIIFSYDSLVSLGYTRTGAISALYPNDMFMSESISMVDSTFNFHLQPNAVALIEIANLSAINGKPDNRFEWRLTAYPNPAMPSTVFSFDVPVLENGASVNVSIYDAKGKAVKTVYRGNQPGHHQIHWNGADNTGKALSVGVYFVRTQAVLGNKPIFKEIQKAILLK